MLNLRAADECGSVGMGVLATESDLVASLGLAYASVPTRMEAQPTPADVEAVRKTLLELPQPVYLHCRTMRRSAAVVRALGLDAMEDVEKLPSCDTPAVALDA